ncbi:hypothetical protein BS78_07G031200 [Paspalum vaginatum]|nr:hypothetical protein BS78_07G031200 [Paspalum vaginatum]
MEKRKLRRDNNIMEKRLCIYQNYQKMSYANTNWVQTATKRELVHPVVARFAIAYLTLKSLHENQGGLINMFCSEKWRSIIFAKTKEGKAIAQIVLGSRGFFPNVLTCLKAGLPLVKVLHLVDSDGKPAMPYIYEQMDQAKNRIKDNFNNVKKYYMPILKIIDDRWESQLSRPLHVAAYYLKPAIHYIFDFNMSADIKLGFYACLDKMIPDKSELVKIHMQLDRFKSAKGLFGDPIAVLTRPKKTPADWWDSYGDECLELRSFAIRVLSLTCSSCGCEHKRSTFEMVHSKRRNRPQQQKMNDLVFVMYNLKLKERQLNRDSLTYYLDDVPSDDEWITEKEDPALPHDKHWIINLDRIARRTTDFRQR